LKAGLEAVVTGARGLALADSRPDVVLSSLPMEEIGAGPAMVWIGEPGWSAEALRIGVRAILPPDASAIEIAAAVEAAAAGLAVIEPAELESLLSAPAVQPVADSGPLTARELEVLRMLAEGAANKHIA